VANNKTPGKDENSNGLCVAIETIITTKPTKILKVNKMSKTNGGRGITSIAIINNTKAGIPRLEVSNLVKLSLTVEKKSVAAFDAILKKIFLY
tara:strand:+ start:181 stop:459 length:279 start_codon:yes stop_codon:yes gene_type:complete